MPLHWYSHTLATSIKRVNSLLSPQWAKVTKPSVLKKSHVPLSVHDMKQYRKRKWRQQSAKRFLFPSLYRASHFILTAKNSLCRHRTDHLVPFPHTFKSVSGVFTKGQINKALPGFSHTSLSICSVQWYFLRLRILDKHWLSVLTMSLQSSTCE